MAKNNSGCGCLLLLLLLGGVLVGSRVNRNTVKVAGVAELSGKLSFLHKLNANGVERQEAERVLRRRDPKTMDAIAALVRDSSETNEARALALRAILVSGDPRVTTLAAHCLRSGRPGLVEAAQAVLAGANDPVVHAFLLANLASPDGGLRQAAALVLGQQDDPRAIEPLIRLLREGDVKPAGEVLAAMTPPPSLELVLEALAKPGDRARAALAQMLGRSKDPKVVAALLTALRSDDDALSGAAASSLGTLARAEGGAEVIDKLGKVLRDRSAPSGARKHAAAALGAVGDARAAKLLTSVLKERNATLREAVDAALVVSRERRIEVAAYTGQDPHGFATLEQLYAHTAPRRELDEKARNLVAAVGEQLEREAVLESPAVRGSLVALDPYVRTPEVQAAVQRWAGIVAAGVRAAVPTGADQAQAMKAAADEYRRGGFSSAAGRYAAILRVVPAHLEARNDLALAEIHLGHDTLAQAELEVLRKLDDRYVPAQVNLTVVYERIWPGERARASALAYGAQTAGSFAPAAFNAAWYRNAAKEYPSARELLLPLAGLNGKYDELARINDRQAAGR